MICEGKWMNALSILTVVELTSCHQIIYTRKVIIMSFEIVSGSRSQSD
jgi:hypothetical protein